VINAKTKWWDTTKLFFWHFQGARTPIFIIKHSNIPLRLLTFWELKNPNSIFFPLKKKSRKYFSILKFLISLSSLCFFENTWLYGFHSFVWKLIQQHFCFHHEGFPPAFFPLPKILWRNVSIKQIKVHTLSLFLLFVGYTCLTHSQTIEFRHQKPFLYLKFSPKVLWRIGLLLLCWNKRHISTRKFSFV